MNDFTKEELNRLLLRSYSWVSYPENQNKDELDLINKIKSMIHNYPEPLPTCYEDKHDWEFVDHGSAGYYKCLVCQRSYNEQTRKSE
jgi:hypothetical protein